MGALVYIDAYKGIGDNIPGPAGLWLLPPLSLFLVGRNRLERDIFRWSRVFGRQLGDKSNTPINGFAANPRLLVLPFSLSSSHSVIAL